MKYYCFLCLTVFILSMSFAYAQELPKCAKCSQPVYSSWWKYCPACGEPLPEFKIQGTQANEEIILGNIYQNSKWNFSVDKPSEKWSFKTGKEARDINKDAVLVIESDNAYGMIIVEEMPDMDLNKYEKIVMPKLEGTKVVSRNLLSVKDGEALIDEINGSNEGIDITWRMLLYHKGNNFYQVHFWAMKSLFERHRNECNIFLDSFKLH